ncbi:MAG: TetR/AcrR family transcriptional regulator [Myxococcota bacterium]|nr:TetR/AcrR family transcriptional regulator [Myxococcota bacterium]
MKDTSEEKWIIAGLQALSSEGIGAVKVEALARQLGLTKGSFYHHFKNRGALLERMLAFWKEHGTEALIQKAEQTKGAAERFDALLHAIFTPTPMDGTEAAVRAWAATDDMAAAVVASVDERRIAYVRDLFAETGMDSHTAAARSEVLYRVVIGDFMWRSVGGTPLGTKELEETSKLFLTPPAP